MVRVLANPNFRRLWLSSQIGTLTMWILQVANGYVAFTLTLTLTARMIERTDHGTGYTRIAL
jgi:hypothetical protein